MFAIEHFSTPTNVGDVLHFLGMVNKFFLRLAAMTIELLVKENVWF